MFSRLITCTINPAKLNDFKNALNNQFLPRIQAQPGLVLKASAGGPCMRRCKPGSQNGESSRVTSFT